jgi:LruC domain-containing protein
MKYCALFIITLLVLASCKRDKDNTDVNQAQSMEDLIIPEGFDFKTSKTVTIKFEDFKMKPGNYVKFDIYIYDEDQLTETMTYPDELGQSITQSVPITNKLNDRVATKITNQTQFDINLQLPSYITKLYIIRNEYGLISSQIINITQNKARYIRAKGSSKSKNNTDILYGCNGGGDLFTIDPIGGSLTIISSYPDNTGSYACAVDPTAKKLYTLAKNKVLYSYDLSTSQWTNIKNIGLNGPRLEFNRTDGLLYFSTGDKIYKIDPTTGNILSTYTLTGMSNYGGGDICFDASGTTYLSSTDGLYKATYGSNNQVSTQYISAQSLPNFPTSLTFDSNDELWWATIINNQGYLYIMDKITGGFQAKFTPYSTPINDLATLPYDSASIAQTDSDNDGIVDFYDEFPNDPEIATTSYTPSVYGWGSYAFEDLWPDKGDYDFNDLVVNYRYTHYENAQGLVAKTKLAFRVKNVGGSFQNGFGLELPMNGNHIQSVSGYRHTNNVVTVNAKGLESNQTHPVIIVFDNAWDNFYLNDTINIMINYFNPIHPDTIGNFNAFMFINGDRGKEVHMAGFEPTDLCNLNYFGTADDNSIPGQNRFYKTSSNLPWGIDIIHDFTYPKEKKAINKGYKHFASWAQSGGQSLSDWYKEKTGYRDASYLSAN